MTQIEDLYKAFLEHQEVTTDSRVCPEGSIFFALKGETFNGNLFALKALEQGCSYAVVDEDVEGTEGNPRIFRVEDSLKALQMLANYHRKQLGTPILAITGTNGKTTTKELTSSVLSKKYNVLFTQGNFNNHIGVPKTLLRLTKEHELAVVEMGANHPGEIKALVNIAEPDFGIITNVGRAHLLGFGSFEGVIHTKGELYDFLREKGGTVFINESNPHLMGISEGLKLVKYKGQSQQSNDSASQQTSPYVRFSFEGKEIETHLIGAYNADNMMAAATIGRYFNVPTDDILQALADYVPSNNRSQLMQTKDNTLIVDAYNANPTSMKAALDNFRQLKAGNKMVVLGDMRELGEESLNEHLGVIGQLKDSDIKTIWLVGEEFKKAFEQSTGQQVNESKCQCCGNEVCWKLFPSVEEVVAELHSSAVKDKTILVKGSNSTRLYTLVSEL